MFRDPGPGPSLPPEKLMSLSKPGVYAAYFPPKIVSRFYEPLTPLYVLEAMLWYDC